MQDYTPASDFDPQLFYTVHGRDIIVTADNAEKLIDYCLKEAELMIGFGADYDSVAEAAMAVIRQLMDRLAEQRRLHTLAICQALNRKMPRIAELRTTGQKLEVCIMLEAQLQLLARRYEIEPETALV